MPSRLTARDAAVLRHLAFHGPLPAPAIAGHFPSMGAAYVRMGLLARRGLVAPSWVDRHRVWEVTPAGRAALGLSPVRPRGGRRRQRVARVILLMARLGYSPAEPPRGRRAGALWFRKGDRVVLAVSAGSHVPASRAVRIADRLGLHRNAVAALVVCEPGRGSPREIRAPLRPPIVIVPEGAPPSSVRLP